MHILLDLVPGHTSEEHPWFKESSKVERNEYSDRYIWTDKWFHGAQGLNYIAEKAHVMVFMCLIISNVSTSNYGFTSGRMLAEGN